MAPHVSPSRIPLALTILVFSPSVLLFRGIVFEEDSLEVMLGAWDRIGPWLPLGRPIWWPITAVLKHAFDFPQLAYVLMAFYSSIFVIYYVLTASFFARLLGSRNFAYYAAALIFFHFHFLEARVWNGHQAAAAGCIQLFGLMLALGKPNAADTHDRLRGFLVGMAATFIALNTHQSGAFIFFAALALAKTVSVLDPTPERDASTRVLHFYLLGFLAAAALYGLEVVILQQVVELNPRAKGSLLANMILAASLLPLWSVTPLAYVAQRFAFLCPIVFMLALLTLIAAPSSISRTNRIKALAFTLAGGFLAQGASLMTNGSSTSRALVPSLIALWGGGLCMVYHSFLKDRLRGPAIAAGALLAIFYALHVWQFGLVVALKREDGLWREKIVRELRLSGVDEKEDVIAHYRPWISAVAGWGDLSRSLFSTRWGGNRMLTMSVDANPTLPSGVKFTYTPDPIAPLRIAESIGRLATRSENGKLHLDLGYVTTRQMEICSRYLTPWRSYVSLPLGELCRLGAIATDSIPPHWESPFAAFYSDGTGLPSRCIELLFGKDKVTSTSHPWLRGRYRMAEFWVGDLSLDKGPPNAFDPYLWELRDRGVSAANRTLRLDLPVPNRRAHIYLRTLILDRPWVLRGQLHSPPPGSSPLDFRIGLVHEDASESVLFVETMGPGDRAVELEVSGDASPRSMLWLEAQTRADAVHGSHLLVRRAVVLLDLVSK